MQVYAIIGVMTRETQRKIEAFKNLCHIWTRCWTSPSCVAWLLYYTKRALDNLLGIISRLRAQKYFQAHIFDWIERPNLCCNSVLGEQRRPEISLTNIYLNPK